jgi:hypothetical protein
MTVSLLNMNKLTDKLFEVAPHGWFTSLDAAALMPGSEDRRYGLVKRAISSGEIIHIRRGLYCLSPKYQRRKINLNTLAQLVYGPSYVSLESALSWHGWIPEAVYTLTSVSSGKSKEFKTPLGTFSYRHVPQKILYEGVDRLTDDGGGGFMMASPLKALADYVYANRKDWKGLKPLSESLRIEPEEFESVTSGDIDILMENYTSRRVNKFLEGLRRDLKP